MSKAEGLLAKQLQTTEDGDTALDLIRQRCYSVSIMLRFN